jgi:hypothetical protein
MSSNINPNNIDGAYPVAGQDNNSQGFRDNFTNTKTNFAYAAAEITDLQNKAVLKQALTGTTLNNNMLGSILSNAQLQEMSNTVVNLGTLSGTVGVNYTAGSYQTVTTAGSISIAFSNFTPAGTQDCVLLQVSVTNIAYTMQLPSAVGNGSSINSLEGIQGYDILTNTITFAETGTFVFQFITYDAGSTIYISELTRPRAYYTNDVLIDSATQAANIRKAKQAQAAQAAQAQMAVKEAVGTYNKKTGAAELDGKTMTALSDLPPHIQQQIQAKQRGNK